MFYSNLPHVKRMKITFVDLKCSSASQSVVFIQSCVVLKFCWIFMPLLRYGSVSYFRIISLLR